MKKRLLLLVISIVLQSCFSYKVVENNSSQYEIGKSYRVKQGKKDDIIRITSKTDSTLVVWSKFETKTVAIDEISKVEKRKFSIVKTVLYPAFWIAVFVGLVALAMSN